MKLIGKQIVVELPEKKSGVMAILDKNGTRYYEQIKLADGAWNEALSEVAKMNPAWEVDEKKIDNLIFDIIFNIVPDKTPLGLTDFYNCKSAIAHTLASNPSKWLKRKDSDEAKAE